jgi:hypothetical protein
MDAKLIKSIASQIYRRFPEVSGSTPKVVRRSTAQAKSPSAAQTFLLTFRGTGKTADGKSIPRVVRVTASASGKIIKVTTSR